MSGSEGLLRAFVWLRWRALANSLARRRRSSANRLMAWAEAAGQVLLWGMAVSGALGLGVAALFVPWALQEGREAGVRLAGLLALRGGLAVFTLTILVIPAFQGLSGGSFGRTRLLLLPIRHRALHALELAAHLGDPWVLLVIPGLLAVGLATTVVAGLGGLVVLAAGALLAAALAALSATASFGIELLLRNRRRAEALAVVFMVVWISVAMVPGMLQSRKEAGEVQAVAAEAEDGAPRTEHRGPGEPAQATGGGGAGEAEALRAPSRFPALLQVLPSESYSRAVVLAAAGLPGAALLPAAALAVTTLVLYALSHTVWRRLLAEPGVSGGRTGARELPRPPRFPGLSPGAAAVAWAQLRGLLRTMVGRLGLLVAPVVTLFLVLMLRAELPAIPAAEGGLRAALPGVPVLFAFGAVAMGLLSIQAFVLNQFAVDGPGFSLTRLAPLDRGDLVVGKAAAGGVLAAVFIVLTTGVVVSLEPEALPFWPAVLLSGASTYLLLAPFHAWVSMHLPKAVDLARLGKASQPNQLAGLLGMLCAVFGLVPALLLGGGVFLATGSAAAVTAALAVWTGATAVAAHHLLRAAAWALAGREESIYLAILEGT
ncbi:MAG TPA: hypothetical protein VM599_04940 [Thermoanaerobaculia bacterium]|nr:hypothetical protein [Thermoanaerobaculia bacterium]